MSETVREEERRGAAHANGPCERVEPTQQEPPAGELVAVVVQLRVVHAAHVARDHAPERAGPQAMHHVGRQVVQVATIEQQRAVHRVAQRRQEAGYARESSRMHSNATARYIHSYERSAHTETHRGANVAPKTARLVNAHPRRGDVGRHAEVRQPEVLHLQFPEHAAQRPIERAACMSGVQ